MAIIMDSNSRQWSALPSDLLVMISGCLESRLDIHRFRGVCHSWWSSVPLPHPPLVLKLPYPICQDTSEPMYGITTGHLTITESSVLSITPLPGTQTTSNSIFTTTAPWIFRVQFLESGKLVFKDLLSSAPVGDKYNRRLPQVLDLLDYSVKELGRTYRLEFVDQYQPFRASSRRLQVSSGVNKVAVTSSFCKIGDGFTVMVLKNDGKLAVWRIGEDKRINVGETTKNKLGLDPQSDRKSNVN
ncbi:hypothetical protein Tsubulata_004885 [Turnera subulata]|uniref:F-box domain-containing protein n=1 Tax=Turnera subulata TaxID=218843 RepID=A0A9Q0G103_9ROSI|nr:hypothetical protein Tsubulata_004885 [Turnera subulata]